VRLAVVPPLPALLPRHTSIEDPVPELRTACRDAVAWLLADDPHTVSVVGDPADVDRGVGQWLLGEAGHLGTIAPVRQAAAAETCHFGAIAPEARPGTAVLLLLNGSARRSEKAPGHLDERSFAFDDALDAALRTGDPAARRDLDVTLADELLASGVRALRGLEGRTASPPVLDYADDPFGVQYWVVRWETADRPEE
jgi:hypothetical protein